MTIKERKAKVLEYKAEFGETVKADMRALNVYRPEYEKTIEIYADMLAQYRRRAKNSRPHYHGGTAPADRRLCGSALSNAQNKSGEREDGE